MSSAIGPGDWIEFVGPFSDAAMRAAIRSSGVQFVGSYRVGTMTLCEAVTDQMRLPDGSVAPGLKTRDVKAFKNGHEMWLGASQWRPIYRPRADFIESLKAPPISAPARETEDA